MNSVGKTDGVGGPPGYTIAEGHAHYRLEGTMTIKRGIESIAQAIVFTRERGVGRLLVDVTGIKLTAMPTVSDRYEWGETWAHAARGSVRVVIVAPKELIDPGRFGILVAANRGLESNVFATEAEALAWLER